jgi:hypothetical protein
MNLVSQHPEWKRLIDTVMPLVASGKREFSYAELAGLGGVDIATKRGRQQFIRFREEASEKHQIWFENVRGVGYRMVAAREHVDCSARRVGRARRITGQALKIATNVRFDQLTESERKAALMAQSGIAALYVAAKQTHRESRRLAGSSEVPSLSAAIAAAAEMKVV